jgi:anti-anti-sigma factor
VLVLDPGKSLDNTNAHQMVEAIASAQAGGYRHIIVDMTHLEFLSSAGVGAILGTVETSREHGGDIILSGASTNITHVLKVLDLVDYLTIVGSETEAAALAGL